MSQITSLVVVVDDDAEWREALRASIGELMLTADTLDEGLELTRQTAPSVVILDAHFPGSVATGVDLVPAYRQAAPRSELIVVTSMPVRENARRAVRTGASAYMWKENPKLPEVITLALWQSLELSQDEEP